MLFNTGISVFNETCKKFSLNNGIITNSYFNKYIIKAIKSGRIYLINTDIRDCICQSILDINECSSFILLNSTINNITNTNSINLQNDSKTASSIFTFSKVSSKISIEKSNFLNIFNQNTFIFSIYNSTAIFSDVIFLNVQINPSFSCIKSDSTSNLIVYDSIFPHPKRDKNDALYFPIHADGSFSVQNVSLVSTEKGFVFDYQTISLNDENKYYGQLVFISLFILQIALLGLLAFIIFSNDQHRTDQYELLPMA